LRHADWVSEFRITLQVLGASTRNTSLLFARSLRRDGILVTVSKRGLFPERSVTTMEQSSMYRTLFLVLGEMASSYSTFPPPPVSCEF
jgi:hypothetical protein